MDFSLSAEQRELKEAAVAFAGLAKCVITIRADTSSKHTSRMGMCRLVVRYLCGEVFIPLALSRRFHSRPRTALTCIAVG